MFVHGSLGSNLSPGISGEAGSDSFSESSLAEEHTSEILEDDLIWQIFSKVWEIWAI